MANTPLSYSDLSALSDKELLRLLLECCRIGEAESLSEAIIGRHGDLSSAAVEENSSGDSIIALLRLIPALSRKSPKSAAKNASLSTSAKACEFFRKRLSDSHCEQFTAAAADESMNCTALMPCITGSLSSVALTCRKIAGFAISSGCDRIFIAHSHPTGEVTPSEEDIVATKAVISALRPLGIVLADHIIVGAERTISLRNLAGEHIFDDEPPERYSIIR